MNNILNKKILYYANKIFKIISIVTIALFMITAIILLKYKPVYAVTISGEMVGYVKNKEELNYIINNEILKESGNIAFVTLDETIDYEFKFIINSEETNEEEIVQAIESKIQTTYKVYAVTLNGEDESYANSLEEAEQVVNEIEEKYNETSIDLNLGIREIYTEDINQVEELKVATETTQETVETAVNSLIEVENNTINGVYFAVAPTTGNVSSRFGSRESIRDHVHMGLDIAAPNGTEILAVSDGTISFAGWSSGYGNLVKISHGNGVETYYGHCSKLLVTEGQDVKAGDVIALVGSTGNSTGNHLHFEIRINDVQINPQQYFFKE